MANTLLQTHKGRRSASLGLIPGLGRSISSKESLEIFRRICLIRYFENEVGKASESGFIHCPIYLSIGQEAIAAAISTVMKGSYLFTQHRGHSVYLAFGGDPVRLMDELLGLPNGCCNGMGGSPCIQDPNIKMIGHEGLIGEHVPIAVGAALANPEETVVCFFGDGAVEEDHMYGALGFAATHNLPILFVCEDNDLSVLTPTKVRRSWNLDALTRSMGIESLDIADDPWLVRHHAEKMSQKLPALLNCRTSRVRWHVGYGTDGPPEWDRFALVKKELSDLGLCSQADEIESEMKNFAEDLWEKRLQKLSEK